MLLLATPSWQVCKSSAWLPTIRVELHPSTVTTMTLRKQSDFGDPREIHEVQPECLILQKNMDKISFCHPQWFSIILKSSLWHNFLRYQFLYVRPPIIPTTEQLSRRHTSCFAQRCASWWPAPHASSLEGTPAMQRLAVNHKDLDSFGSICEEKTPLTGKRWTKCKIMWFPISWSWLTTYPKWQRS